MRNCDAAIPPSSECACALTTSRPCSDRTPAIWLNVPAASGLTTVITSPRAGDVDLAGGHHGERLGIGEQSPGHLGDVAAAEHVTNPGDEFVDESLLPVTPRRRARGQRVGLGERMQQVEHLDRAGSGRHLFDRGRIGQIASHRDVGQQQVVLDHRDEDLDVGRHQTELRADRANQLHADLGVVAGIPLADVVEERTEHQQVGARHAVVELRRRWPLPPTGAGRR